MFLCDSSVNLCQNSTLHTQMDNMAGRRRDFLINRDRKRPANPSVEATVLDRVDGIDAKGDQVETEERKEVGYAFLWAVFEIVSYLFYSVLYVIDCGSDISTAYVYFTAGEVWHFWLTVLIVTVSGGTTMLVNLYWYYCEYKNDKEVKDPNDMPPRWLWAVRVVMSLCLLGPFLR